MVGGGGNDTLTGGRGADLLLAQSNNDTLTAGTATTCCAVTAAATSCPAASATTAWAVEVAATGCPAASGADRFSGGSGSDASTDYTASEGDTTDGTIP